MLKEGGAGFFHCSVPLIKSWIRAGQNADLIDAGEQSLTHLGEGLLHRSTCLFQRVLQWFSIFDVHCIAGN
jgi:hypothetical protein